MKAMLLKETGLILEGGSTLEFTEVPIPTPGDGDVLIKISACGVCHTELDEIEGRTPPPGYPIVPGHQVVGRIASKGALVKDLGIEDRVGVGWIFSACGKCNQCTRGYENLCAHFKATGRDADGGYAEYMVVPSAFCYPIPQGISDIEAAPLLCAGAIGYRSLNLSGLVDGEALGLIGFGASSHLVIQLVNHTHPNSRVYVFARNRKEREFALKLGATWAGDIDENPPVLMDSIIDTTPAWKPIITGLGNLKPGGQLVINAIRKEDGDREWLTRLDYPAHLWMEKELKSVANVTRADILQFLDLAGRSGIRPEVHTFPLTGANKALVELKAGKIPGAKVIIPG
jgi:propanol-preferring alcohol dehydrogenase